MKPIAALAVATLSAVATFAFQGAFMGPQAYASSFQIPAGPNWRQDLLSNDPGKAGLDRRVDGMERNLSLSSDQAAEVRSILQHGHDRIEALLLTAPPSLTRDQFDAESHQILADTRERIDTVLTADQLLLKKEMRPASSPERERHGHFVPV
jgi:hypothetical protein